MSLSYKIRTPVGVRCVGPTVTMTYRVVILRMEEIALNTTPRHGGLLGSGGMAALILLPRH